MTDLAHEQLLLIAAIASVPLVWQFVSMTKVHALWIGLAVLGWIFAVVMW